MRNHTGVLKNSIRKQPELYVMVAFGVLWFLIFAYGPMAGLVIAFKNYRISQGIFGSEWVGFAQFIRFFKDPYFFRVVRNTFLLSFYEVVWGFPAPIILALSINEMKNRVLKSVVQSVSYLPHFISTVVLVGLVTVILSPGGIINSIVNVFGPGEPILFFNDPGWFRTIFVSSGIWQHVGWGTIIYLAAISGIDPVLYESAGIDGANRLQKMRHITVPCMMPTIKILFILRMGELFSVGFEKVYLLYNPSIYETSDVLTTYLYRVTLLTGADYSYGTAIGMFNGVISLILLLGANYMVKRFSGSALF